MQKFRHWEASSGMQHTRSQRRPLVSRNVDYGLLFDVYSNVYIYLLIWYWGTFCGDWSSPVFIEKSKTTFYFYVNKGSLIHSYLATLNNFDNPWRYWKITEVKTVYKCLRHWSLSLLCYNVLPDLCWCREVENSSFRLVWKLIKKYDSTS